MRALYRRYRPKTLSEVVGQEQVTETLRNALAQNKIFHAYLFIGPRGTGKTSVARIFAHEINKFKYELEDDYVDIIEIDGASNRGIDNIRELREKVAIAPTSGKYKVYIIDEVHMLTKEAFNALLKTLEEPPKHVIFIMATTDAYKVPITITSRAQTYTFKLADYKVMFNYLKSISEKEKIKITDDALDVVVKKGGGSFRDSMSLLDQISNLSDKEITKELVIQAMGLPEDEKIEKILNLYRDGNILDITTALRELLTSGIKAETLAEEMINKIISEPKPEWLDLLSQLINVKTPFAEAKLIIALCKNKNQTIINTTITKATTDIQATNQLAMVNQPVVTKPVAKVEVHKEVETVKIEKQETVLAPQVVSGPFKWEDFIERVHKSDEGVYGQLLKTKYEFNNNELHIYPEKRIIGKILSRDNNKKTLIEAAGGVKITIHEAGDTPDSDKKDETLQRISDIMGGEVGEVENNGGNPF